MRDPGTCPLDCIGCGGLWDNAHGKAKHADDCPVVEALALLDSLK
jgi:hypothetical protein